MSGLNGKHIITTCASEKAEHLLNLLSKKGAVVYNYPMISIKPTDSNKLESEALKNVASYNWIVFSSSNGVKYFYYWLNKLGINTNHINNKFAVIGSATQNELSKNKQTADFIGKSKDAKDFANEFSNKIENNQRILWVTGNLAMNNISDILSKNHQLKKLEVYVTDIACEANQELIDNISNNNKPIGIFLSPSAVQGFYNTTNGKVDYNKIAFVPIGKTTANAIKHHNQEPLFVPSIPNIDTLVTELNNYYN